MRKNALCLWACIFLLLLFFAILFQTRKVGFEPGHYGWVTSHALAIAAKASAENNWVGYAIKEYDADGKQDYLYFDRYPVIFSVLLQQVQGLFPSSLGKQVSASRVVMNSIFILTMFFFFLVLNLVLSAPALSLAAVLLAFSGHLFMFYKDMVHYDQPALLGISIMLYLIARFEIIRPHRWLYVAAPLCVCLGRGYAGLSLLGLWLASSTIMLLRRRDQPRVLLTEFFKSHPLRIFILSLGIAATALSYNIVVEMTMRNVSYDETSIVETAKKRIGWDSGFDEEYKDRLTLPRVMQLHGERVYSNLLPEILRYAAGRAGVALTTGRSSFHYPLLLLKLIALCILSFVLYRGGRNLLEDCRRPGRWPVVLLLALTGFVWLLPMKRLFVFHDYTAMYHAGFHVLFMTALLLGLNAALRKLALPVCLAVFVLSLYVTGIKHNENSLVLNRVTADFTEIQQRLGRGNQEVYIDGGIWNFIPGAEYALGFYLSRQWLSERPRAPFALSRNRNFGRENLTPKNEYVFLFSQ